MNHSPLLLLLFCLSCAPPVAEKKPTATFDSSQCPKVDPQRLNDISAIDRENQEQINKVSELEQKVDTLMQQLSASLKSGQEPVTEKEASVATTGNRVRVRLSDDLLFNSGSAHIRRPGQHALAKLAAVLKTAQSKRIEIVGHTDTIPMGKKYQDNWVLSFERAHRVGTFLISQGIEPARLLMTGYGDTDPLVREDSAEAHSKNRRVEIFVEPTDEAATK